MKNVKYLGLLLVGLAISHNSFSQSDNYWSWNFNTLSVLLAGSVVGGHADASAIYFNPSLIGKDEGTSLTLSASLLSLQFLRAENIAGDDIDMDKFAMKIQPRFISYNFPSKNERISIEASVLTPVSEDISYTLQHSEETDVIQRTEGLESYSGYVRYSRKYEDIYIGMGASYQVNDRLTLGATAFVSVKLMQYEFRQVADAFQEADSVIVDGLIEPKYIAESSFEEALKYWDVSLVSKFGAHYQLLDDRLGFGVNLTFPNLPLFGRANVRKSLIRSNVYDNSSDVFTSNEILIGGEADANTTIKSPFSAAFGMQYLTPNRKNAISFTIEYFHQIDGYELFQSDYQAGKLPDPWNGLIDPAKLMTYSIDAKAVTNLGVGFRQTISPSLYILGGFRTDFTNGETDNVRTSQDGFKVKQVHLNKYHITLGPVMKFKKIQLITGIQYSFGGNNDMYQLVNYSDPIEYNPNTNRSLEGIRKKNATFMVNEISLFLGLTIDSK